MRKKRKQKPAPNPEELRRLYKRANLLSSHLKGRPEKFRDRAIAKQYNEILFALRNLVNDPQLDKTITPTWYIKPHIHIPFGLLILIWILVALYYVGGEFLITFGGGLLFVILMISFGFPAADITHAPPWYFSSTLGEVNNKLQLLIHYIQDYLESNYPNKYIFSNSEKSDKKDDLPQQFEILKERNVTLRQELAQKNKELDQLRKENINLPELKQENYGLKRKLSYIETELAGAREELHKHDIINKPFFRIEYICKRFHIFAKQISERHDHRNTLNIGDEYDVQDLMHALLSLYFDDIRPEEWAPSYAGGASRMDFLLPSEKTVIEIKKTRSNLDDKKIGEQLIIDIERYRKHPECKTLICFVYDPDEILKNPKGLEKDINRQSVDLSVRLLISPDKYFSPNS